MQAHARRGRDASSFCLPRRVRRLSQVMSCLMSKRGYITHGCQRCLFLMTSFRLIASSVFRDASVSGWPGVAVSLHAADSQAASSGLLHLPASWAESSRGLYASGKMPHPRNLRPAPTIVRRLAVALPGTIRRTETHERKLSRRRGGLRGRVS